MLAFFTYSDMRNGAPWSYHWYLDDEELTNGFDNWAGGDSGASWVQLSAEIGLPGGHYRLELRIGTEVAVEGEFDLEEGEPGARLADTEAILLGLVLDADTGRPVPGATIMVLHPGVGVQAFLKQPDERAIYAWGEADSEGRFTLSRPLAVGVLYTLLVDADGYQPAKEEHFTLDASGMSPQELTIELRRRP